MSKYTTELRWLVETGYNLGLTTYPIFSESYRKLLNDKIIQHYMFREIGFETPGLFVNRLNEKMNMIMPYYNQLYASEALKFDPLLNFKSTESNDVKKGELSTGTTNQSSSQTISGTTDTTANQTETVLGTVSGAKTSKEDGVNKDNYTDTKTRKDISSDTPQGLLSAVNIENELYATTAAIGSETDSHKGDSTRTINTTESTDDKEERNVTSDETSHGTTAQSNTGTSDATSNTKVDGWQTLQKIIEGYTGVSGSSLLNEFRTTFLNIDAMIIEELETLFMCVY